MDNFYFQAANQQYINKPEQKIDPTVNTAMGYNMIGI